MSMDDRILAEMDVAVHKAIDSLARYKFWMFGYHAAQWVLLNRLLDNRQPNPFKPLVDLAREIKSSRRASGTASYYADNLSGGVGQGRDWIGCGAMSKALSGSRLRTAALKAVGLYNRSLPVAMMDPCKSSIAAAWPLLEAAVRKHRLERVSIDIGPACAVVVTLGHELDESGVFVGAAEGTTGEAAAEAICRALVAAAEKTL